MMRDEVHLCRTTAIADSDASRRVVPMSPGQILPVKGPFALLKSSKQKA
jgi:hypothetical protein